MLNTGTVSKSMGQLKHFIVRLFQFVSAVTTLVEDKNHCFDSPGPALHHFSFEEEMNGLVSRTRHSVVKLISATTTAESSSATRTPADSDQQNSRVRT
jgi:hypothetical protein